MQASHGVWVVGRHWQGDINRSGALAWMVPTPGTGVGSIMIEKFLNIKQKALGKKEKKKEEA